MLEIIIATLNRAKSLITRKFYPIIKKIVRFKNQNIVMVKIVISNVNILYLDVNFKCAYGTSVSSFY